MSASAAQAGRCPTRAGGMCATPWAGAARAGSVAVAGVCWGRARRGRPDQGGRGVFGSGARAAAAAAAAAANLDLGEHLAAAQRLPLLRAPRAKI